MPRSSTIPKAKGCGPDGLQGDNHSAALRAVFDLKGDRARLTAIGRDALPALPDQANHLVSGTDCRLGLIGPGHWLLLAEGRVEDELHARLQPDMAGPECSIVPISDALTFLSVTGPEATEVMAVASPLDLHPSVFGADRMTFTEAFGIKALIFRMEGGFEIGIDRSYADWFQTMLERTTT